MTKAELHEAIAANAQILLSGGAGIVEVCRVLVPLLTALDEDDRDLECIRTLVAVESETDMFPIGETRELWAPEALLDQDRALREYLDRVRDDVESACWALIETFGTHRA